MRDKIEKLYEGWAEKTKQDLEQIVGGKWKIVPSASVNEWAVVNLETGAFVGLKVEMLDADELETYKEMIE